MRSTDGARNDSFRPLGQSISTRSIFGRSPQPKMEPQIAAGEIAGTAANFLLPFLAAREYQ